MAASLCCITPAIALIAGTSGIASTFSWVESFRPYLIGITILVLAFAWYQKLKPKKQEADCECEEEMSTTACRFFYECENCKKLIRPKKGDCCVYCSYGTVVCPPMQQSKNCCNRDDF